MRSAIRRHARRIGAIALLLTSGYLGLVAFVAGALREWGVCVVFALGCAAAWEVAWELLDG